MFLIWILLAPVVGLIGSYRKIGFWGAVVCSLLLSPVIGLIITLLTGNLKEEEERKKMLELQKKQYKALSNLQQSANVRSVMEELKHLKKLKDEGILTESEFNSLKQKALQSTCTIIEDEDQEFDYQIYIDEETHIPYNEEKRIEGDSIHYLISFADGSGGDLWGNMSNTYTGIENDEEIIYYNSREAAVKALYMLITTGKFIPDDRI